MFVKKRFSSQSASKLIPWIIGLFTCLIILLAGLFLYNILSPLNSTAMSTHDKRVIGLVVTASEDDWKMEQYAKITAAVNDRQDELILLYATRSQASQIEQIRALIVYQVDYIVFSPLVENGWSNVLNEAAQTGIPIIAVDQVIRSNGSEERFHSISFDYEKGAESLIKKLHEEDLLEDEILELVGPVNAYTTRELSRGFRNELDPLKQAISFSYCAESLSSYAEEITYGIFEHKIPVRLILAQNDAMAEGAVSAVTKASSLSIGFSEPILTAVGGGANVQALFNEGKIQFVLTADNSALVGAMYEIIDRLDENPKQDALHLYLPLRLLEHQNKTLSIVGAH